MNSYGRRIPAPEPFHPFLALAAALLPRGQLATAGLTVKGRALFPSRATWFANISVRSRIHLGRPGAGCCLVGHRWKERRKATQASPSLSLGLTFPICKMGSQSHPVCLTWSFVRSREKGGSWWEEGGAGGRSGEIERGFLSFQAPEGLLT